MYNLMYILILRRIDSEILYHRVNDSDVLRIRAEEFRGHSTEDSFEFECKSAKQTKGA